MTQRIALFNVNINRVTLAEATRLVNNSATNGEKILIVTPNVDHLSRLKEQPELLALYAKAKYVFADGMPIVWFSYFLPKDQRLPERVTGSDLVEELLRTSGSVGLSIGFIGGKPGMESDILNRLRARFPTADVRGVLAPPFDFENDPNYLNTLINDVNAWNVDHLFVGLGFPKQERFIIDHWDELTFKTAMGVGAGIDMVVGYKKRAPNWVRSIGMEWFWRFLQEPRRLFKRYFIRDMKFLRMAWKEYNRLKISSRKDMK